MQKYHPDNWSVLTDATNVQGILIYTLSVQLVPNRHTMTHSEARRSQRPYNVKISLKPVFMK